MKVAVKLMVIALVACAGLGFKTKDDSGVKHVYSKVVVKRNDKAQVIALGAEGQDATIFIKTRELTDEDEISKGTELWIKVKSKYHGHKTVGKQHRLMFGTNAYREQITVQHVNGKTKEVHSFQFDIDIRIIDSESEIELNV